MQSGSTSRTTSSLLSARKNTTNNNSSGHNTSRINGSASVSLTYQDEAKENIQQASNATDSQAKTQYELTMELSIHHVNKIVAETKAKQNESSEPQKDLIAIRDLEYVNSSGANAFIDLINQRPNLDKLYNALLCLREGIKTFDADKKNKKYEGLKKPAKSFFADKLEKQVLSRFKIEKLLKCWTQDIKPAQELKELFDEAANENHELMQKIEELNKEKEAVQEALITAREMHKQYVIDTARNGTSRDNFTARKIEPSSKQLLMDALGASRVAFIDAVVKNSPSQPLDDVTSNIIVDLVTDACQETPRSIADILQTYAEQNADHVAQLKQFVPEHEEKHHLSMNKAEQVKALNKVIFKKNDYIKLNKNALETFRSAIEKLYNAAMTQITNTATPGNRKR